MKKLALTIFTAALAAAAAMAADGVMVSNPANLKGKTYTNPIIYADYSDPDVVAAPDGRTFYMTASSFQCAPGLPILKSNDLVNWTLVNYAIDAVPPVEHYAATAQHGKGVWAPCIRYHEGEYYIYWGDPDYGIFMVKTADPEGAWSEPVLVKAAKGIIDTTPLWDEDGRAYIANGWAASRAGLNSIITVSEMSADGTRVIGKPRIVFDGNDGVNHTIEGPKLYRRGDYYYILAPAGGVKDGWQLALRSKNIFGPYEPKRVLEQGKSDITGPHQGAWVTTADGEDWFLHFQDLLAYGRVIHLNPVKWTDGWPVMGDDRDGGGCGDAVRTWRKPSLALNSPKTINQKPISDPSLLFQWHANYKDVYGFPAPGSIMRLYGHILSPEYVNMWEVPNLWLQKFPAERFSFTSKVKVSAKARTDGASSGIIVMGWDYCRLGLTKRGDDFILQMARCTDADQQTPETVTDLATIAPTRRYNAGIRSNMECDIWLKVDVAPNAMCTFSYSLDGKKYIPAGPAFKARAGKWIGAKAGYYSTVPSTIADRGWIDVISSQTTVK